MITINAAAARTASTGPGLVKITWNRSSLDATANATRMPKNIATPPSRGVGLVCTSRSRIFGYSRYLVLSLQITIARLNVTMAEMPPART